jgi:hypothetical protein
VGLAGSAVSCSSQQAKSIFDADLRGQEPIKQRRKLQLLAPATGLQSLLPIRVDPRQMLFRFPLARQRIRPPMNPSPILFLIGPMGAG